MYSPTLPRRTVAIRRAPSKKRTPATFPGAEAATASTVGPRRQEVPSGRSQATVGRTTPRNRMRFVVVFGRMFAPAWSTFFDSW